MDYIKLLREQIDINVVQKLIVDEGCGACSLFVGTTRDNFKGRKVTCLEYEAYENMALKEIAKICSELRVRWAGIKHIAIYHRLGNVPVTEASVVIGVSSPHRREALESVSFAINQLKSQVPIWKKEIYEVDQNGEWKANAECTWSPEPFEISSRHFNFSTCEIDKELKNMPEKLVQIRVNDFDLNRRVKCFLQMKRGEINQANITDFKSPSTNTHSSCARIESYVVKQHHSSGHLKVRRVINDYGPLSRPNYSFQINKLMSTQKTTINDSRNNKLNISSRLRDIEETVRLSPESNKNMFLERIKNIEDRILLLESISPEYKFFIPFETNVKKRPQGKKTQIYMSDRINDFITNIKNEL